MKISDFSFELPTELIAQEPLKTRSDSRLLVIRMNDEKGMPRLEDLLFSDLPDLVASTPSLKNALWVRNKTTVMPARFYAQRPTGGKHEIVLLEPLDKEEMKWSAIIRGVADFKYPQILQEPISKLEFISPERQVLDFSKVDWCQLGRPKDVKHWLSDIGKYPLPPYIKAYSHEREKTRYQSVWRDELQDYSVAAPTASLHFDEPLLARLLKIPIEWVDILLHVGLGTFEPLREQDLQNNTLHAERFEILKESQDRIREKRENIFAIGTTTFRCVESFLKGTNNHTSIFTQNDGRIQGTTKIFIHPQNPHQFVRHLLTNFHLPESSLFILVATFCKSLELAKEVYAHAIAKKYRFFSYGDATLWIG
jgi:S-adenosylmethionine:tRNA ribosyltransferase-isomerase